MRILKYIADHSLWRLLSVLLTVLILMLAVYTYMELALPSVAKLNDVHLQVPLKIYSKQGQLMAQYGVKRRIPVTLDQIPKQLIEGVIATEDARYYDHPGVDFISLVRAAKAVISSGRKVQGASTITMQVARNFFLTRKKTYSRKINEILLAIKIDREFSKQRILELYLNKIYLGNRAYGVAAAAQVYYGKRLDQLSLAEMAMIAGLPQAPSTDNPIANPDAALDRRNHVLARMLDNKYIDQAAYATAIEAPITASYHRQKISLKAPYVAEMVRQALVDRYGKSVYESGFSVYTTLDGARQLAAGQALDRGLEAYDRRHGYRQPEQNLGVYQADDSLRSVWLKALAKHPTVNDMQPAAVVSEQDQSIQVLLASGDMAQIDWAGMRWARPFIEGRRYPGPRPKQASQIVKSGDVIYVKQDNQGNWQLAQLPAVQGAFISLNPANGAIEALCGGYDYQLSSFNRAIQAIRQPGSNFKPFIYSAALAKGFTLASMINDAPVVIADSGENQLWRPQNDTRKFYGPTSLRMGLIKSRNLVSIRLLQDTGIDFTLKYLKRFGFDPKKLPHALSLALGSAGVTPMQIASGYTVFANGGYQVQPYFIEKIVDQNQKMVFQMQPPLACTTCGVNPAVTVLPDNVAPQVVTPQNAYLINTALQGVIQHGTGRQALVLKRTDIAGKTGTTNKQVDAWFSGYNPSVQATVWVGFDDSNQSLFEYGSKAALPIWIDYMKQALNGMPEESLPRPPGLVSVRVDPKTGLLAQADNPNAAFELFRQQYVPTEFSHEDAPAVASSPVVASSPADDSPPPATDSSNGDADSAPLF